VVASTNTAREWYNASRFPHCHSIYKLSSQITQRTQQYMLFPYHLISIWNRAVHTSMEIGIYGRINSFEGLKRYSTKTSFAQWISLRERV